MSAGSLYSAMFNSTEGRFDKLEVWDGAEYINVVVALNVALNTLEGLSNLVAADETRIVALETKTETLDNTKADKFVAQSPLFLKTDVTLTSFMPCNHRHLSLQMQSSSMGLIDILSLPQDEWNLGV